MSFCRSKGRALFLALLGFSAAAGPALAADSTRPNVIFILADDLGYGDLGCYGQLARAASGLPSIQTPRLDQLASQGMRFTQFYAAPSCAPSRCCLNTGFHMGHGTIRSNGDDDGEPNLRTEDITMAEIAKRAGYTTGLIGKWGLSKEGDTGMPHRKGFDHFLGYVTNLDAWDYYPPALWHDDVKVPIPENNTANVIWAQDLFTEDALQFISDNAHRPFYLQVNYTIPHRNLECPSTAPYTGRPWPEIEKRFAAMITRMDTDVGRIVDQVDQLGLANNTLIVFSSDNGPQNKEGHDPEFFDSNGPLRGIKFDFWEGGIRVPFIARWTGRISAGQTSPWIGAFYDFLPTVAELAGAKAPSGIDGISFYPVLTGGGPVSHPFLYWEDGGGTQRTVRMGDWKSNGATQLYNLASDLSEQTNLASVYPLILSQLDAIKQAEHSDGPPGVVPPILSLVGQVSGSGSQYTMSFPTVMRGSAPVTLTFRVKNGASEYANLMEGQVLPSGVSDNRLSAQGGDYAYLVDGGTSDEFSVTLNPSSAGALTGQSIVITGRRYGYGDPVANSPITLTLAGEVLSTAPSDFDGDDDVDQVDFGILQPCISGLMPVTPNCAGCDLNGDGVVNEADILEFMTCMAGPGVHSPCAP